MGLLWGLDDGVVCGLLLGISIPSSFIVEARMDRIAFDVISGSSETQTVDIFSDCMPSC